MKKAVTTIAMCFTMLAIMAGCGRVRYPQYYTLNLPTPPDPPASQNALATLAVREFSAPPYLRRGPIVYKTSPEQIGFYAYHQWATDPRDVITNAVLDRLRARAAFASIKPYDGRLDTGYVLSGRLEKLDEVDYDRGVKVEIALSARIIKVTTGETVWSNAVSEVGDVNQHNVPAVVSEMSGTMERAIEELLRPIPADVAAGPTAAKKN